MFMNSGVCVFLIIPRDIPLQCKINDERSVRKAASPKKGLLSYVTLVVAHVIYTSVLHCQNTLATMTCSAKLDMF